MASELLLGAFDANYYDLIFNSSFLFLEKQKQTC